ncbi:MAG TPA: carboxylating nicotinate-nucleotide diphosphorylase [Armatimonadetes bacterium]|mgnify:FL=1|nr:carboxylating nicotinate-nucleotide diphosphorylase [Armatimonadota bacterium]
MAGAAAATTVAAVDPRTIAEIVRAALHEDIGRGDLTSLLTIPPETRARGVLLAKQDGVMAGGAVVAECFQQNEPCCSLSALLPDGKAFKDGDHLGRIEGTARGLLGAERVALNFLQRLCGIATLTRQFADAVAGTKARVTDTRKTTPGLRVLEKAAVLAGGGSNHRFALYDGILIKDNHIRLAGGIAQAVARARAGAPHTLKIEVETAHLGEVRQALEAGADIIMLDNMDDETMAEAVRIVGRRALVEASGGMRLERVREVAQLGVDLISVGALTHSATAVDISLELELLH